MITPVWIIGFTGHRPSDTPGRTSAEMEYLAPLIREELQRLKFKAEAQHGRAELLCGLAAGADLIAAREAEGLGMPVHVILPMPERHFLENDFQGDLSKDKPKAQHFINLARAGKGGATYREAHGSHLKDDCYYDVGFQIVYASDAVIALWNGEPATPVEVLENEDKVSPQRGGTADVVDMTRADRMPYLKGKQTRNGYRWLPTPVRIINTITQKVEGEAGHFARDDDAGLAEIRAIQHAADLEHGAHAPIDSADKLLGFIGAGAKDWATRLRTTLLLGSGMHFLASLIAAVSAGSQQVDLGVWTPTALASLELSLVLFAIGLMLWTHWKHAQARWLELRLATELTRGLMSAGNLLDPLFPIATDHLPGWRRFCLSVGLVIARSHPPGPPLEDPKEEAKARAVRFQKNKENYRIHRIENQLKHYGDYDPKKKYFWYSASDLAGPGLAVIAVVFILIALIHKAHEAQNALSCHPATVHEPQFLSSMIYYFLPIALPLLAGAIASLQAITDVKRRAQVYPEMVERLKSAQEFVQALRTPASLRRFVRRTEEILLDELVAWYAAAKGISH